MIYVVEDDMNIRELVVYTFNNAGFEASGFERGAAFWEAMRQSVPELVILDIMLPGEDGVSILKRLRSGVKTRDLPVIMLTAKSGEYDRVLGLDCGADDYIVKPFGMMELLARVKALLRRANRRDDPNILRSGGLKVDKGRRLVSADGEPVALTYKEFELLLMLIQARGTVLTRDHMLESVWGYDFIGETRTVDVHVHTLRQKLRGCGGRIETVRGVGYRMGD